MISNYVGKSLCDDSILVRGVHNRDFMEFYTLDVEDDYTAVGIEWFSNLLRKCDYPDFEFDNFGDFCSFVDCMKSILPKNIDAGLQSMEKTYNTYIYTSSYKRKYTGQLSIYVTDYGFLTFDRVDKKNKLVWTLSLDKDDVKSLTSKLIKLKNKLKKLVQNKNM